MPEYDPRVFITQAAFRETMDAMSRPGQLRRLPAFPSAQLANPHVESLVRMLLDQSCGFAVAARGEQEAAELSAQIVFMSSAVCVEAERARFALIAADADRGDQMSLIERLCGGSAQSPERGATVLLECRHLATVASENAAPFLWEVTGPGVEDCHHFASDGDAWFVARAARRDEFPCGIDFILVDRRGELLALPRTAQVRAATSPVLSVSPVSSIPTGEGV